MHGGVPILLSLSVLCVVPAAAADGLAAEYFYCEVRVALPVGGEYVGGGLHATGETPPDWVGSCFLGTLQYDAYMHESIHTGSCSVWADMDGDGFADTDIYSPRIDPKAGTDLYGVCHVGQLFNSKIRFFSYYET